MKCRVVGAAVDLEAQGPIAADDPTNNHDANHELFLFSKEQNGERRSLAISVNRPTNAGSLQQFEQHKEQLPRTLLEYQQ